MYSQSNEDQVITEYFKNFKGTFLDLGAYDGVGLSNTRRLAELGWKGVCVEPHPAIFSELQKNYLGNDKVLCVKLAIGEQDGTATMMANDTYYSTLKQSEVERWRKTNFKFVPELVQVKTFKSFMSLIKYKTFHFISIDCEGLDYEILSQIDLNKTKTKMICVETNSKEDQKYIDYIRKFGDYKLIHKNAENIIMGL